MPPTRNRVVITGIGAITPVGNSVDAFWNALLTGKSGAAKIAKFDVTGHSVTFGAEVKNFDPAQYIDPKEAKRMDPFAQYAVAAAKEAVADAKLDFSKLDRFRCGAIIASGLGGPNWSVASACASANHAMGTALRTIQYGDADLMLAGGSEAALTYLSL